jgi:hypothetical protein
MIKKCVFIILFFGVSCHIALAQTMDISGQVTDRFGDAVAGARVTLTVENQSVTTDQDGMYQFNENTGIRSDGPSLSSTITLHSNSIRVDCQKDGPVYMAIHDVAGRLVFMVHDGHMNRGKHEYQVAADLLSRNLYFLRVRDHGGTAVYKVLTGQTLSLVSHEGTHQQSPSLAKTSAAVDTLVVTHDEYEEKRLGIDEYAGTYDFVLEFDWSDFIYPEIDFTNEYTEFTEFTERFPSFEDTARAIAYGVSRLLYRKFSESLQLERITFTLESDPNSVGWKAGRPPHILMGVGGPYLENYMDRNSVEEMARECKGIMWHEFTHGYQYDDGDSDGIIGIIEGVADCVRYLGGYVDISERRRGGSWDSGYKTTGFFLAWLQEEYNGGDPEFLYKLNQSMEINDDIRWTEQAFQDITGETVHQLWAKYQDAI